MDLSRMCAWLQFYNMYEDIYYSASSATVNDASKLKFTL
jgi:hypothetical protein